MEIFNHPYFLYFAIALVILSFVFFRVIPLLKKAKKVKKAIFDKIYLNSSSHLTPEEYKKLSVGAIYSEQQTAYINSLTTGLDKETIRTTTADWWGITSTESALETLDYLNKKGFAFYFPSVYRAFMTKGEEEQKNVLINGIVPDKELTPEEEEQVREDIQKAYSQLIHLQETYDELLNDRVISTKEDIARYGVIGWDCGRLNYLARLCYDAHYISEEQTWYFIDQAYQLAKQTFNSWDDLAKSYVIGRALWGGKECDNSVIKGIADYLLTESKSPWVEMKW